MQITTRIGLIIVLPIIFGLAVMAVQLTTSASLKEAQRYSKVTQSIQKTIFELNVLGNEVAHYPNEVRARRQWLTKHQQLTSLLAQADLMESNSHDILKRINITNEQLIKLFKRLINAIAAHQTADAEHIPEHEKSLLSFKEILLHIIF